MNKKWFIRVVAVVLAVILLGSVVVSVVSSVTALAVTQSEIDELKAKADELDNQKSEVESKVNSLEYENMTTLAQKAVLDEQVSLTQAEIDNINEQIALYNTLIAEKEVEVQKAQQAEDEQWEHYKVRMRAMEENGAISYIAVLFDASSFSDLLARIDFIGQVMANDKNVYEQFELARQNTIKAKTELENTQAQQEAERVTLTEKEAELQKQVDEASKLIAKQEESLESFNTFIAELDSQQAELDAEIDELIAAYEKQEADRKAAEELARQEAANNNNNNYGGGSSGGGSEYAEATGSFIWPAPASNIVTSTFGTRLHPIYQVYRTHYGVDIGAGYGTNVLAADGGTVMVAEYHWSFGNYIMINHGNGYVTLYGHMSSLLVSAGEYVSQGDVIGLVGSTGESTGPHLHFEVRASGTRIDPLQFFSGYVISE